MSDRDRFQESTRDRLRQLTLFGALEDESLDRLAGLSRVVHVPRKTVLFSEGTPYKGMFVVLEGLAVVYKLSDDGRMLILHVCRPGDTMAEVPLFEERDAGYPAHGRTTRDSEILFLPREPFIRFLKQHPEVAWEMLRTFAGRMKELGLQLEGVTLREVSSRLARYLLREVEAAGMADAAEPVLHLPPGQGVDRLVPGHGPRDAVPHVRAADQGEDRQGRRADGYHSRSIAVGEVEVGACEVGRAGRTARGQ